MATHSSSQAASLSGREELVISTTSTTPEAPRDQFSPTPSQKHSLSLADQTMMMNTVTPSPAPVALVLGRADFRAEIEAAAAAPRT